MPNSDRGPVMLNQEFPSNKRTKKNEVAKTEKKVEQVTKGLVVKKKKTLGKKFAETFLGDDLDSVSSYIIHDVIIPAAKNMMSDSISNGVEMLLFGTVRGNNSSRNRNKSTVSYGGQYRNTMQQPNNRVQKDRTSRNRARHNFDDIVLESRGEAEEVLSHLVDLTVDYGMASVADLYDLVGITSSFTDNKYGWDELGSAGVSRVRDGYLINLPRTIILD